MVTNNTEVLEQQIDSYRKDVYRCISLNIGHMAMIIYWLDLQEVWYGGSVLISVIVLGILLVIAFCRVKISSQWKVQYLIVL